MNKRLLYLIKPVSGSTVSAYSDLYDETGKISKCLVYIKSKIKEWGNLL